MFTGIIREFLAGLLALLMCAAPAAQVAPQPAEESSYVQEIEKDAPARSLSASAGTLALEVDSPVGSLPRSAKASLSKVSKAKLNKIRKEAAALLGTEIIDAVAFDISFLNNGVEIEPDGKVNITVNFPAIAEAPDYTIIHFRDDGTTEIVPGNVTTTSATFSADSFSVYAVVGTDVIVPRVIIKFMNGDTTIATMYVKASDTEAEIAKIVYDPGVGTIPAGQSFKGWTTVKNYTLPVYNDSGEQIGGSKLLTIAGVRAAAKTAAAALGEEDVPLTYYPALFKSYKVVYQSDDENPITVGTSVVEFPSYQTSDEATYVVNMGYTVDSGHNFQGWIPTEESTANIVNYPNGATSETVTSGDGSTTVNYYPNGTSITVTGDVTFTPKAPEGCWLVFDENGKGGKYNAPQFVLAGQTTSRPIQDSEMTRFGYSFDGWYYFPEGVSLPDKDEHGMREIEGSGAVEYVFDRALPQNTTIYAKWKANEKAAYTVIFWTQDLSSIRSSNLKYEVAGSYVNENGAVGEFIPYTVMDNGAETYVTGAGNGNGHYTGFCLTEASKNQQVRITPEGDAVLNLYYNRILYNFKFYLYRQGTGNNSYDYPNNSGTGRSLNDLVTWHSNQNAHPDIVSGYTIDGNEVTIQSETVGGRTYYYFVMPAYYGEDISGKWPTYDKITGANGREAVSYVMMVGTKLKPNPTDQGSGTVKGIITVMNENILGATNDADGNYVMVRFPDRYNNWRYHIWFETVAGADYSNKNTHSYNGKTYYEDTVLVVRSSNTTDDNQNEPKYTGFTYITRIGQNSDGTVWQGGHWTTTENSSTIYHLNYVYDREQFKISYFDGQYVDGNNNGIQNRSSHLLHESEEIGQGVAISNGAINYQPTLPEGEAGYVFEGWYIDEGCTAGYTWSNMPVGGIRVYAKWRQIQYRTFLHTGLTGDDGTNLSWGTTSQALSFRIDYGKKVSAPTGVRNGYKFLGWYTDPEFKNSFNAEAFILNESTVTASYDKNTTPTDPEVRPWAGPWDLDEEALAALSTTPYNSDLTGWDHDGDDHGDDNPEGFVPTPKIDRYWITKRLDLYAKWSKILPGAEGINVVYNASGYDMSETPVSVVGSNAPTDSATYIENANASAGAASTPPAGFIFDHWVVCTWNGSAYDYDSSSNTVLPGGTFAVNESDTRVVDNSNGTKTYTVQLLAIYKKVEAETLTHIYWYDNYTKDDEGTEEVEGLYHADENLKINEAVLIYNGTASTSEGTTTYSFVAPTREFYEFKGWTKTKGGTTADFLIWDATNGQYKTDSGKVVTHVAADEKQPYDDLYAVWEKTGSIQIYHSGVAGGAIETVWLADIAEKGITAFDFTKELKSASNEVLYKGITSGTLYGGYYLENGNAETPNFVKPSDNAAYDGTNWTWKTAQTQAFSWTSETLKNLNGTVIYIKEVPADYMKPYTHIGFYGNKVSSILLVTAVDDLKYSAAGFKVTVGNGTTKTIGATSFRQSITIKAGDTTTGPHTATSLYSALKGGYLGYTMLSGSDYLTQNSVIKVTQYWVTPDGVTVEGTVIRTINIGDGTTDGANKISCSDAAYPVVTNEG